MADLFNLLRAKVGTGDKLRINNALKHSTYQNKTKLCFNINKWFNFEPTYIHKIVLNQNIIQILLALEWNAIEFNLCEDLNNLYNLPCRLKKAIGFLFHAE